MYTQLRIVTFPFVYTNYILMDLLGNNQAV